MCGAFRCILVTVHFLFAATGFAMLTVGLVAKNQPETIIKILSLAGDFAQKSSSVGYDLPGIIQSSSMFLIVMGAIVGVVGLIGCLEACCDGGCMQDVYLIALILILLAEVALVMYAKSYPSKAIVTRYKNEHEFDIILHVFIMIGLQFKEESQNRMNISLVQHFYNDVTVASNGTVILPQEKVNLAWTSIQFELGCCGVYGPGDYANINFTRSNSNATVPISCCALKIGLGKIPSSQADFVNLTSCQNRSATHINTQNCYTAVEGVIDDFEKIAIGIAWAVVAIEVILILSTVCQLICGRSKGILCRCKCRCFTCSSNCFALSRGYQRLQ